MSLGTIDTAGIDRTLRIEMEATQGSARIELVAPDGAVRWEVSSGPAAPAREAVVLPAGTGPWQVQLRALDAPAVADYRLEVR
jgi:hypothetical protein